MFVLVAGRSWYRVKGRPRLREEGERRSGFTRRWLSEDVYLKRPISLLSPKLEMNKSSAQFTQPDGLISSGDPDCPNRLRRYYVYLGLQMGFHVCFHWERGSCSASQTWTGDFSNNGRSESETESKNKNLIPDVYRRIQSEMNITGWVDHFLFWLCDRRTGMFVSVGSNYIHFLTVCNMWLCTF